MNSNRFSNRSYAGQGGTAPAVIQNLRIRRLEEGKVAKNDILFVQELSRRHVYTLPSRLRNISKYNQDR